MSHLKFINNYEKSFIKLVKINKKEKLKKFFLKSKVGKAIEKRLKLNISSNFMTVKKNRFVINKSAQRIVIFFHLIRKIFRLKSDAY